ncbi:MAG: sigma-70 family RNA polymerase sigma factor [Planctomycetota bacterium]|nr:sigma-70 family RNA polymerase sigma factor [Planctomycetaceae bacterium]MDQ3329626.1 sigma-70 family RNA polymerase sigma factor [Planctomycetota bacterium]
MSRDDDLVSRFVGGDVTAFDEIVRRYRNRVYGYLRSRVLVASEAEELTREVFRRLYVGRRRFKGEVPLQAWLMETANFVLRACLRADGHGKSGAWAELTAGLETTPSDARGDEEIFSRLRACIDELAPSAREAIELTYRGNRRLSEIGQRLHRSEGAATLLVFRARQMLRHCFERKAGTEPAE